MNIDWDGRDEDRPLQTVFSKMQPEPFSRKTRALNTKIIPALLFAFVSACHDGPTVVRSERVSAVKQADGIRLTNLTDKASGYFIVDLNTLALIDWRPCETQGPDCLRLPANGSILVPFDQIVVGSAASRDVVIYTWWVLPDIEGALHADMDDPVRLRL